MGSCPHPLCMGHLEAAGPLPLDQPNAPLAQPLQPLQMPSLTIPAPGPPPSRRRSGGFHPVLSGHSLVLDEGRWRRLILIFLMLCGIIEGHRRRCHLHGRGEKRMVLSLGIWPRSCSRHAHAAPRAALTQMTSSAAKSRRRGIVGDAGHPLCYAAMSMRVCDWCTPGNAGRW